nr:hypothetical protein BaRGS_001888 [Batillaria attramentaria]
MADSDLKAKRDEMTLADDYSSLWEEMMAQYTDDMDSTPAAISNATLLGSQAENVTASAASNSSSCDPNSDFMEALPWIRIIFGLLMVLENSLSLWALWHVRKMQHAIHRFITSLAVAELLMGVWCCYRYSAEILMGWEHTTVECRLRFVGITYLNFAAILSVCALCLDRCLALHFPFRYAELVTKSRVRLQLALVWLLPFIVIITAYVNTGSSCENCTFVHIASQRTYVVLTVSRCLLIGLIIVSELLLFRAARCQISKIYPNVLSSRSSARFVRVNAKAAVTTSAVVLPFLLLYTPVVVTQGRLAANPDGADECWSQLLAATWLFASAHGLFTPLVFCWRFREVRANLVRLFCRCALPEKEPELGIYHLRTRDSVATS